MKDISSWAAAAQVSIIINFEQLSYQLLRIPIICEYGQRYQQLD